jgi:hypothetical protein
MSSGQSPRDGAATGARAADATRADDDADATLAVGANSAPASGDALPLAAAPVVALGAISLECSTGDARTSKAAAAPAPTNTAKRTVASRTCVAG